MAAAAGYEERGAAGWRACAVFGPSSAVLQAAVALSRLRIWLLNDLICVSRNSRCSSSTCVR
ncbi:MAG: hypothetical protein ACHQAQ_19655, partial [Hyphomicrobiales bacterium]